MRKFYMNGEDILITCSRRIDEAGFARACEFVAKCDKAILEMRKSSIILLQDNELNSIVIERMNTDTFTLHVQYEINCKNVFQIN
ncbi:hypothetical protein [Metabacillus bambusae]|uniref:Uncharacterized protein n=1 Tax=Metabacillus bambusae TaxID=2795218 RepID=A0ABS3N656_9BACI|nr:hypothetical protein [Metabacillus bambusae]MBO1513767.1 hypothetical protein [Metabacillus bambusae]